MRTEYWALEDRGVLGSSDFRQEVYSVSQTIKTMPSVIVLVVLYFRNRIMYNVHLPHLRLLQTRHSSP